MSIHEFEVVVRRTKEGKEQSPDEIFRAKSVKVGSDGHIQIAGENCGRTIKAELWESLQVKNISILDYE